MKSLARDELSELGLGVASPYGDNRLLRSIRKTVRSTGGFGVQPKVL